MDPPPTHSLSLIIYTIFPIFFLSFSYLIFFSLRVNLQKTTLVEEERK